MAVGVRGWVGTAAVQGCGPGGAATYTVSFGELLKSRCPSAKGSMLPPSSARRGQFSSTKCANPAGTPPRLNTWYGADALISERSRRASDAAEDAYRRASRVAKETLRSG